jgi:uncharacterized protein YkwD
MYALACVAVAACTLPAAGDKTKDDAAVKTVERVNKYRAAAGLAPVTLDLQLTRACQAHADYLAAHLNPLADKAGDPHAEKPGLPGYSKAGATAARMSVISYNRGLAGPVGPHVVDSFMATLFHRIAFLRPDLKRIGYGEARFGKQEVWAVLDARSGRQAGEASNQTVIFPGDQQKDVPLLFLVPELPNPIPPEGRQERAGYTVTVMFGAAARVRGAQLVLRDGKGNEVPGWFSSPEKPAVERLQQSNTVALIPKAALRPRTTYTATATATVDGQAWSKTWTFTTAAK